MEKPIPVYSAVFLDPTSQENLKNWWMEKCGPFYEKAYCHHMTLQFRPNQWDPETPWGQRQQIHILAPFSDERCQAVFVQSSFVADHPYPHITVSVDDSTPPSYSSYMVRQKILHNRGYFDLITAPTLHGRVGVYMSDNTISYDYNPNKIESKD